MTEAPAPSKRAAEHGAAKAALQAEFPEVAAELGVGSFATMFAAGGAAGGAAPGGKKRKAPGDAAPESDAKGRRAMGATWGAAL